MHGTNMRIDGGLIPTCIVKVCIVTCKRRHHYTFQCMFNKIPDGNLLSSFTWHHCCRLAFSEYNFGLQAQCSWLFLSVVLLFLEQRSVKMRDAFLRGTNLETAIGVILGTDSDCGICGWPWQFFALGGADRPLLVTNCRCIPA